MNILLAFVVGAIYAVALYLMMRRNLVKLVIGLALLSHGTNLLIFTAGGLVRADPPIIEIGKQTAEAVFAVRCPRP